MQISNTWRARVASGDVIAGKFRVERILGRGGMGVVVAARHLTLDRRYAIKLLASGGSDPERATDRFLREARAAAILKSEHVCHVFDFGNLEDGTPFMVMEYLEGDDLGATLSQRGPLPVHEAVCYAIQACEALAEAHGNGIVHRDLKPANLFLTKANDGSRRLKVLDFGIAKLLPPGGALTMTSTILGSPRYMSPEQLRASREIDGRTDIWSLGVTLYELVTGTCPFHHENLVDLIAAIVAQPPTPPSQVVPALPPALDTVVLRCMQKIAAERYHDVATLARDLLPFAATDAVPLAARVGRVLASARRAAFADSMSDAELQTVGSESPRPDDHLAPLDESASAELPVPGWSSEPHHGSEETLEQAVGASNLVLTSAAIATTDPMLHPPDPRRSASNFDLRFFEGVWQEFVVGTTYYARIHRGELHIAYRYGTGDLPTSTAECYDCTLVHDALFGRFKWIHNPEMKGYVYLRFESKNRLIGGWCYENDLPDEDMRKMPGLDSLAPLIWIRKNAPPSTPEWVERYFSSVG